MKMMPAAIFLLAIALGTASALAQDEPGCNSACNADLNGDAIVDGADMGLFFIAWGPCSANELCCADFDGDHVVAGGDLGVLLNGWGDCADEGCTDDAPCDDDDPCTIDFCENGVCHHERIPGCGDGN